MNQAVTSLYRRVGNEKATVSFQLIALNFLVSNNHNKDTKTYRKIQIGTIPPSPIAKYPN